MFNDEHPYQMPDQVRDPLLHCQALIADGLAVVKLFMSSYIEEDIDECI
jgi:hypothetical protein